MSFRYLESFHDLQPGDVAGARALYGAPKAPTVARAGPGVADQAN
jgi:hypothetical protein